MPGGVNIVYTRPELLFTPPGATMTAVSAHPFVRRPNRTLLGLALPVLLSLIAEPLTGLVDTAFIARLGEAPLAALGVATAALSSLFWILNFFTIGTQTEVSQADGAGQTHRAREVFSLGLLVGTGISLLLILLVAPLAGPISGLLGAEGAVLTDAITYFQIRLLGTPALVTTFVCFGALRGVQNMRLPSLVAIAVNAFNIALDYPFIFGWGFIPAMGVAGAAWASTLSQYIGAAWALTVTVRRFGFVWAVNWREVRDLFSVGGNLFVRTGLLTLFLLVSTRVANQIGVESGAAHQVLRQVFLFTALALDAFAVSTQSLVGYFVGASDIGQARRAATLSIWWSLGTGAALAGVMLLITDWVIAAMVPAGAVAVFIPAWWICALSQPITALAFSTDGVHMGTRDYALLRNGMIAATSTGLIGLALIPTEANGAFTWVWLVFLLWAAIRAAVGWARVYIPIGTSPLRPSPAGDAV